MLTSMRHYVDALAPIRNLRVDWREPLAPDTDIPQHRATRRSSARDVRLRLQISEREILGCGRQSPRRSGESLRRRGSRVLVVLKLVAVAAAVATIAAGASAETASAHPAGAQCLQVRASVLNTIRDGLLPAVRPKLRSARAVKARGTFTGRGPFAPSGVYFISADLGTRGIATWAASGFFVRGKEAPLGRITLLAMSKTARAVADPDSGFAAGVFPPSGLAGLGIKTTTYGYAQSRACVK
jgi:hypothetical protein